MAGQKFIKSETLERIELDLTRVGGILHSIRESLRHVGDERDYRDELLECAIEKAGALCDACLHALGKPGVIGNVAAWTDIGNPENAAGADL